MGRLTSGCAERFRDESARPGAREPWTARMKYISDMLDIRFARIEDGVMHLT